MVIDRQNSICDYRKASQNGQHDHLRNIEVLLYFYIYIFIYLYIYILLFLLNRKKKSFDV